MKIKTRLIMFNLIIIGVSAISIIAILGVTVHNLSKNLNDLDLITVDENSKDVREIIESDSSYNEKLEKLEKYGYELNVYEDNINVFGDKNHTVDKIIRTVDKDETKIIFVDNSTGVIKKQGKKIFVALKEHAYKNYFSNNTSNIHNAIKKFAFVSVFSVLGIIFLAWFFSQLIIKKIMKPVYLLSDGAKRIKNGNYNDKIIYESNDEFNPLVNNFNVMQEHLKIETEKNQKYLDAKRNMINGISHDVRTPLTAVKGYIKGIQDGVANTPVKKKEYLNIAYDRTLDIEKLLNRLFETYNYENGEIKLDMKKVNINNFFNNFFNSKHAELENQNVNVNLNSNLSNEYVYIDEFEFGRIFENLINNSIKYARSKNLIIDVNIWKKGDSIKISFKDNGIGVKDCNIKYLFDEFYKEDESRTNLKNNGSGLGLFIVKTIVESHNGTINAKNDKGLCFEITLKGVSNGKNIDCRG